MDAKGPSKGLGAESEYSLKEALVRDIRPGLTVLIIEDQADLRKLFARLIKKNGVNVLTSASAEEARSLIEVFSFDGIFCDIGMPGESGLTFISRLRASNDPRKARLPVAALTGFESTNGGEEIIKAGFDLYLLKPVPLERFREALLYFSSRAEANGGT